jgi:hypothetical protein
VPGSPATRLATVALSYTGLPVGGRCRPRVACLLTLTAADAERLGHALIAEGRPAGFTGVVGGGLRVAPALR